MLQAAQEGGEAERWDLPDRLEHDAAAHLRAADLAVDERDRHFDDAEAGTKGAVRGLDLKCVAPGVDGVEVDRLEHLAAVALEASGQVADADSEQDTGVQGTSTGNDSAPETPVADAPSRNVTRSERELGLLGCSDETRHVSGVVREIAVHLEDPIRAGCERVTKSGDVCRAEALLVRTV